MRPFRAGLVALVSTIAGLLCSPAGAATVNIACHANIAAAIAANPPGTVFQLAGSGTAPCTYSGQSFQTRNYITIEGDCSSRTGANTILDGTGASLSAYGGQPMLADGYADRTTGVAIQCVTIQNYGGNKGTAGNTVGQLNLYNRWLLQNCTLQYSGGYGAAAFGSSTVRRCRVASNYAGGIAIDQHGVGTDGGATTIIGNEVTNNNLRQDTSSWAAGVKILGRLDLSGPLQNVEVFNNYIHDNLAEGVWSDGDVTNMTIRGNTIIHNQMEGIRCEISSLADISFNVVNNNDYGGPSYFGGIYLSNCANVAVHDNNVLVAAGTGGGIAMETVCRGEGPAPVNNAFYRNTVTFLGSGGLYTRRGNEDWDDETALGKNCPSDPHPTSAASNAAFANIFYSPSVADAHFDWGIGGAFFLVYSLATAQSSFGTEIGSTIAAGNGSVPGCTQIGCTGSGWPY